MSAKTPRAVAEHSREAAHKLSFLESAKKNAALGAMADAILASRAAILEANTLDVADAERNGVAGALVGRLKLTPEKVASMAKSVRDIAALPDPVGAKLSASTRPNGLVVEKVRVPIGVILIIYESRPNVTADCIALCFKSGNAVILKGGKESARSNQAIFDAMSKGAQEAGVVPCGSFALVQGGRAEVSELLKMSDLIDLVIPRGGEGLIRAVAEESRIPVIKHYKGVCHVFVDKAADLEKAERIVVNAKTQNPGVCNAMETLLVDEAAAPKFLPRVAGALLERGVELRGDDRARSYIKEAKTAKEEDWYAEYLDLILAVRVVKGLDEAMAHIEKYGSRHSDAIVTEDKKAAERFSREVDSACVFVNCSTRFNDGGEFGMGAEMGISTDKLHARGPMGLEELTTYKYVVRGDGQIRQ